MHTNQPPFLK